MIWAIIPAAGSGSRTGLKENKIFASVSGMPMIKCTVNKFIQNERIDGVCVVCREDEMPRLREILGEEVLLVKGGRTRGESVYNGLKAIKGCRKVLIHDGARPFVDSETIDRVIDAIAPKEGAIAGVGVIDTVKRCDNNGFIIETPERSTLYAAQTPQGFMYNEILFAYENADREYTDDAAVYEAAGGRVRMVKGNYGNKKVTTREDMEKIFLTGIGYDVHAFQEGRKLILGGVEIPYEKGLAGHSDADVLLHAISDAVLGAAGLGDIGVHFPDTDSSYAGISSMILYKKVMELIAQNGFRVVNISAVIVAQEPKMRPYIQKMNENIALASKIDVSRVNVAATTTEHMGFEGRKEGISARASVMLVKEEI